jgi:glycosyltransferase involved in cell wall biosynthesis
VSLGASFSGDSRLRICIFSRLTPKHRPYAPPVHGLLGRVFQDLGHEVIVLTTSLPDGKTGEACEHHSTVHYLPGTKPGRCDLSFWKASAEAFDRLHSDCPFDLVFGRGVATWGFHSLSKFSGQVPVIAHEGTYPRWLHQLERRIAKLAPVLCPPLALLFSQSKRTYRTCLQRADLVVCNSPALANALRRIYWWAPPRTEFVPYGVDLSTWMQADERPTPAGPPRIAFVGRLTWDKGALAMVDILARMRRRDVIIEAIGPMTKSVERALRRAAAARGVSDRFITPGPEKNAHLPERLHGATAYLFPSTHPEGLSKSVMEAMAAALPVVAYRISGMDTLIDDGVTGWLVPCRDNAAAAEKLDELLEEPSLVRRMGQAARTRLETNFAPSSALQKWESLLGQVTTRSKIEPS